MKWNFSYISRKIYSERLHNGTFSYFGKSIFKILGQQNFFYISEKVYLEPWHNETFLYFRKGIFLIFQEGTYKARKRKKLTFLY